jgi:hypothetical protein
MNEQESMELAFLLTSHLRQLTVSSLDTYLRDVYDVNGARGLSVDLVYATEVAGGNFATGCVSSVPVRTREIGKESYRRIPFVDMVLYNAASDLGNLWPHPIICYYAEFPRVISKEGIGHAVSEQGAERTMIYYRVLTLDRTRDVLSIATENKKWIFKR